MRVDIITEKENSPFRHFVEGNMAEGRRYCFDVDTMDLVMKDFLASLQLKEGIRSLEIGAGHTAQPSRALHRIRVSANTLDSDITEIMIGNESNRILSEKDGSIQNMYSGIEKIEEELKEFKGLYPALARSDKVKYYLGDVAFIGHEKSQLRNEFFDLMFFWGSIHGTGFCSSIESYNSIDIPITERLSAPLTNISSDGFVAHISGFFNYTGDPFFSPKNVRYSNGYMLDTLLLWSGSKDRKPKRAIVFGLSPEYAAEYMSTCKETSKMSSNNSAKDILEAVNRDTMTHFKEGHHPMFSNRDVKNREEYIKAIELLTQGQQEKIGRLGLIDAVAIQYE